MTMAQNLSPTTAGSGSASAPAPVPGATHNADDRLVRVGRARRLFMSAEFGSAAAAVIVFIGFSVLAPAFASPAGVGNFLDPAATLGIMAVAVALLMIGGEFDLSAGVMTGSTALVTALVTTQLNTNVWFGMIASLVFAVVIGLLNGILVHRTKLPSFIITLGTMFMLWGLNYAVTSNLTHQVTVSGLAKYTGFEAAQAVFGSSVGGFQISLVWWIVLTVVGIVLLTRTRIGNWIAAVGGNATGALAVGVPVAKVRIGLFVGTAVAAWLVGQLTVVRYASATVTTGIGAEFNFIIAAVIGGCLLTGGAGSVLGASIGALIFGMVQQGMPLAGLPSELFKFFLGAILLVAVFINLYLKKKSQAVRS
ncbi:ABC transporter permease [Sinomonas sp. ASV486]|uniref:ABC transporter permease n=1 Tax=Sinomonas sp. ASV486 TaxID=3051170 RepID=UPI0027DCB192|nr:ABC transporter permease [Sinomonas sp. ASV486]MDQ4489449.1 ABC transporter permease [Sinomonas sp. ASV486]